MTETSFLTERELTCLHAVLERRKWKASVTYWARLQGAGLIKRTHAHVYYSNRDSRSYALAVSEDECRAFLAVRKLQEEAP